METEKKHNLIVILGPTASGKTRLAATACRRDRRGADLRRLAPGLPGNGHRDGQGPRRVYRRRRARALSPHRRGRARPPLQRLRVPAALLRVLPRDHGARQDADRRGRDGPLHRVDPAGIPDAPRTGKRSPERGTERAGDGGIGREASSPEPRTSQHDGSHRERAPGPRHRDRRTHVKARIEGSDRAAGHRPPGDRGPLGSRGASRADHEAPEGTI